MDNRYEFILLFDVTDGNPNGDPDAGNLPRVDVETGQGLVTDVCLKRKVRNFVELTKGEEAGYEIYVKEGAILNNVNDRAYSANDEAARKEKDEQVKIKMARDWMCRNFFDVRTFGAVMSTKVNCGQVRGPVQLSFARSIDSIVIGDHSITRMAVTTEAESTKQKGGNRTMGRKFTVPYALYKVQGFINPYLAEQTGFNDNDLNLFWDALQNMFEFDRSASRGLMEPRALIVFKHDSKIGNAPAHRLFNLVLITKKEEVAVPRAFSDYEVTIREAPEGVEIIEKILNQSGDDYHIHSD